MVANIKDYLNQIRYINMDIQSRQRELDQLRATMYLKTSTIKEDVVQETNKGSYDDKYMKLFEIDEEINDEVDKLVNFQRKVRDQIEQIDDPIYKTILRERYLNKCTWEQIAEYTSQSVSNVHKQHGKALREFSDKFQDVIDKE